MLVPKSRSGDPEMSGTRGNKPSLGYTQDRGEATLGKPVLLKSLEGAALHWKMNSGKYSRILLPSPRCVGLGAKSTLVVRTRVFLKVLEIPTTKDLWRRKI